MTLTLYTFGQMFGLPDPSPFVTKADLLLKLSGLPYATDTNGFGKAPKGKLPYLRDGETIIADSTFIRWHLERAHGIDFDAGHGAPEKALGWAIEKMLEEQLYWTIVDARWMDDANFAKGPAVFFEAAPKPVRPIVKAIVRRKVRGSLKAHGMGRHSKAEIEALGKRTIESLSTLLGDKPYLLGETVSGSDATAFAFAGSLLCPLFETPLRGYARSHANLVAYEGRLRAQYYPELPQLAG